MTSNAEFKRRVRQRMERTGERYMTARAHLLTHRAADTDDQTDQSPLLVGGSSDLGAVANALARAGVVGPEGKPITELDVFGLGGGVGLQAVAWSVSNGV